MSNNIKTTDVTAKSAGAQKAKKNAQPPIEVSPKDQLKNIKTERKELNSRLKALTKQENQIKKASAKKKKS